MPKKKSIKEKNSKIQELFGLITVLIGIFLVFLVYGDASPHLVGKVGQTLKRILVTYTGINRYFFTLVIFFFGIKLLIGKISRKIIIRYMLFIFLIFFIVTSFHFPFLKTEFAYKISAKGEGGGLLSYYFSYILNYYFGEFGSYIVLFILSFVTLTIMVDFSFGELLVKGVNIIFSIFKSPKEEWASYMESETEKSPITEREKEILSLEKEGEKDDLHIEKHNFVNLIEEDIIKEKIVKPKNEELPSISLLHKREHKTNKKFEEEIEYNKKILEDKFLSFGISIKIVNVVKGPTITRYEIKPPPGIKVNKILSLGNDIALALGTPQVRIEAPVPGKKVIGVEVPNKEREVVYIRELIESEEFQNSKNILPLALGKGMGGKPVIADLVSLPHLLIAGATSSGKSVCINSIIISFLFRFTPKEVRFLMIDPKMVELSIYERIPHLLGPIVTDPKKAALALEWVIKEMERRFRIFADLGTRNLESYNKFVENLPGYTKMPFIVVIIDELADLMMVAPRDVEGSLCRLAQMARATGIHLIVATQRPSVDVITGLIKANFPSRIAFTVSSQVDSRTIIDTNGAEKLLGKGDMLYLPMSMLKPIRVQGAYVSDEDVKRVVEFLRSQKIKEYTDVIHFDEGELKKEELNQEEEDDLLKTALNIIYTYNRASASLLQRELKIGYPRAARLIGILEKKGYIGPQEGSKPRKILRKEESI